jgi:penicillin-binding protein 1C
MAASDSISDRLRVAVVAFEDRRFYQHDGIDLRAILRAARDNLRSGRTVSGGSTLSMQVARMASGKSRRGILHKAWEALRAHRLEAGYSKAEILDLWLNHAPFGGNTVGIEAACYRYFGRSPASLSWAEAAVLAVLPNAPGLIRPGRNADQLRQKRDRLLQCLRDQGYMSTSELELAKLESLPSTPLPLPQLAPHLLQRLIRDNGPGRYRSDLLFDLQQATAHILLRHHRKLRENQVHNLSLRVSEVRTGHTIVYHGNVPLQLPTRAGSVDLMTAPRSPGSLLKPLLYAAALSEGKILPATLLADVPTRLQRFRPTNFHDRYDGAVPADEALIRSLNVPFVHLLRDYDYGRFHRRLRKSGFEQMGQGADHYGLSLILGGAEITQEEIHNWFLGAAQALLRYDSLQQAGLETSYRGIDAGALYLTFDRLRDLRRPTQSGAFRQFDDCLPIAWKTGTSFGHRDAWAVGATPDYVISVWVGNASGEGRPGLVGVEAAAPVLFDILRMLDRPGKADIWFPRPYDALAPVAVCQQSGALAGPDCPTLKMDAPRSTRNRSRCTYHRLITVDASTGYRTTLSCNSTARQRVVFVLPETQAYFYQRNHPDYAPLPPYDRSCSETGLLALPEIRLLYPEGSGTLSHALNWKGEQEPFFFEVVYNQPAATLYWHIDGLYRGQTSTFHRFTTHLTAGDHLLEVTDEAGQMLRHRFIVD